MPHGFFIGLATLDLIYLAEAPPQANQKLVAQDALMSAGGPACNAAVTFAALGGTPTLMSVVGQHPVTALIRADLATSGVDLIDLLPDRTLSPPVSSIVVTQATGDRAVISLNATKTPAPIETLPDTLWEILPHTDVILIDGHQIAVSAAIAAQAQRLSIPTVLDGGSWKPGLEQVLPYIDYAICSANFHPPHCVNSLEIFAFLQQFGIAHLAITHGANPIEYLTPNHTLVQTLAVPQVPVVDTLGAGDIFHGAFCFALLTQDFPTALATASQVAAQACQFFGTRAWIEARSQGR